MHTCGPQRPRRPQLSETINRLDEMIDTLSTAIPGAVADSVREVLGTGLAVAIRDAVREAVRDGAREAVQAAVGEAIAIARTVPQSTLTRRYLHWAHRSSPGRACGPGCGRQSADYGAEPPAGQLQWLPE
jgi:hypothetical protein